jgi:hypothetical protein
MVLVSLRIQQRQVLSIRGAVTARGAMSLIFFFGPPQNPQGLRDTAFARPSVSDVPKTQARELAAPRLGNEALAAIEDAAARSYAAVQLFRTSRGARIRPCDQSEWDNQ